MPIFGYICNDCNTAFEELVLSSAKEKKLVCPACASSNIKKKLSLFAVNSSRNTERPDCSSGCGGGFEQGGCGSGMCGCHGHGTE